MLRPASAASITQPKPLQQGGADSSEEMESAVTTASRAGSPSGDGSRMCRAAVVQRRAQRLVGKVLLPQSRREGMYLGGGMPVDALQYVDQIVIRVTACDRNRSSSQSAPF